MLGFDTPCQIVDLEVCLAERSLEIDVLIWAEAASLH